MNKNLLQNAVGFAAFALMLAATPAGAESAKPSPAEITKARGECAAHKQKVRTLEAADPDSPKLAEARLAWEHACGQAQALIDAAEGRTPPPLVAPRPVVELPPPAAAPPAAAAPAPAPAPAPPTTPAPAAPAPAGPSP